MQNCAGYYKTNLSGELAYKSFVPSSLFSVADIELSKDVNNLLITAHTKLAILENISTRIPSISLFVSMYVRKEALMSSQIEGTQATLEDILDPGIEENANRNVQDVVNYTRAIEFAVKRLEELPLCNRLLKETHAVLMEGVRGQEKSPGEFRRSQNWLGGQGSSLKNARYIPPNQEDMLAAMSDLEKFMNEEDNLDVLLRIALLHYQFETIHPFLDGNGRLGRLLIILFLIEKKIISTPALYISYFLKRNRVEYYDRLTEVREKGNYEQWIHFFLQAVITSAQAAINTDGRYDVALSVINNGKNEISGFAITACYEGETPPEYNFDGPRASMEKKDYRFVIPVSNTAMTVSLKALDNGTDEIAGNNSVQAKIALVKKVLIEEFTTELCSNCPDAAASLHEVLESEAYKNRAVAVCHHAGFYTDFLTKPCDSALVSLYSLGYAPAMMYDRYPMFSGVVHGFTGTVESIKASIDKRISEEACYALGFDVKYAEDTKVVKVNVSVERQKSSSSLPQRLLVWLTEDEVLSQNQRGATGNFKHKHVIREYNNTFGENIEWNGTRFSKDYEFTVDKEWKLGNLNIVASVADHDSENPNNRIVVNTELLSLRFLDKSGVEAIDDDSPAKSVEYYNLNGCKTTETAPKGIYIKKTVYESGRTSVEKVVNLTGGM